MNYNSIIAVYILILFFLTACHPGMSEFSEEMDLVVTKYNNKYNFSANQTYAMSDKIIIVYDSIVPGKYPSFVKDYYAIVITDAIKSNMSLLGYKLVKIDENPDLIFLNSSWQNTTIYYDYWTYWMGNSLPFMAFPVEEEYVYISNSLLMFLVDPSQKDAIGKPIIQWAGVINGMFIGTYSETRIIKSIDQAFAQSPYLIKN